MDDDDDDAAVLLHSITGWISMETKHSLYYRTIYIRKCTVLTGQEQAMVTNNLTGMLNYTSQNNDSQDIFFFF